MRIVDTVRASPVFIRDLSIVAMKDGRVAGHILLSPVSIRTDTAGIPALSLAPVAVLLMYQEQGIGSLLIREGLTHARELGHRIVIVVGEPWFYPRFGFVPARGHGLEAPFPVPDEAFMVLELAPGALDGISGPAGSRNRPGGKGPLWSGIAGMVSYPPAFLEGLDQIPFREGHFLIPRHGMISHASTTRGPQIRCRSYPALRTREGKGHQGRRDLGVKPAGARYLQVRAAACPRPGPV